MMKKTFQWLRIIGILLFIWIASHVEWKNVWQSLVNVQPVYILGYFLAFIVATLLKVVRLRWVLSHLGYQINFSDVYQSVIEPAFYGMVTPARVGEFSKVFYLSRFGISHKKAWAIVLIERLIDCTTLLITSIAGAFYFFVLHENILFTIASAIMMLLLLTTLFRNSEWILIKFSPTCNWLLSKRVSHQNDYYSFEELAKFFVLVSNIFIPFSVVIILLSFLQLSLLATALNTSVSGVYLGVAYAASTLTALLPISVSGLGTREAIYISILGHAGVSESLAVTISLLDGFIFGLLFLAILCIPIVFFKGTFTKTGSVNQ